MQTRGAVKTRLWSQATLSLSLDSAGPQLSHLYSGMVAPDEVPALLHAVLRASSSGSCPTPSLSPPPLTPPPLPLRKLADCAQLLEVDDMVRLAVPDSKCVYTYLQELYRSLVQKGLVKTKKK